MIRFFSAVRHLGSLLERSGIGRLRNRLVVAGLALGFISGLGLDVFHGSLLGQHALALSLVSFLAVRFNLLMRAKPIFEQSLFVFLALLLYEVVLWAIDGWTGRPSGGLARWVHTVTGSLLWPVAVGVLGRFHSVR